MYPLVKIGTDMYPKSLIESVNFDAIREGQPAISVSLKGVEGTFDYWGAYRNIAYAALVPAVLLRINNEVIWVRDIEWVNLNANFNGQPGVEIRVAGDPVNVTHQFTGDAASIAYDQLIGLAPMETQTMVN